YAKAKMIWFNRLPTNVAETDIYPKKAVGSNPANNQATVLDLQYFPNKRGMFNYSMDLEHTLTPTHNWNGVMKPLSVSAVNLLKENVNFIELYVQVSKMPADGSAKMLIDLGAISERVLPNGPNARGSAPNSEDLVLSSYPNGTLQEGEDVGLDMRNDAQEQAEHADLIAKYRGTEPSLASDPSGDDYYYNNADNYTPREDFTHINGTEGNQNGPGGRIPDSEDLNANGICDQTNSYFEYEVPLDTVASRNPLITGGNPAKGWYQIRIPVRTPTRKVGSPTAENVEYIRVAFANVTDTVALRIADFNLVGNQWQKVVRTPGDSSFDVGVVSLEENPDTYDSPPGVIRERDKTKPDEVVLANEQSMAFFLTGLPEGHQAEAVRFYTFKALDLFNYRQMKMFVHGDVASKMNYIDQNHYDAEIYFRFGLDSLNFYEYRAPIHPQSDPLAPVTGWIGNDVVITFADVTALKQARDSANVLSRPVPVPGGPPGSTYRVLGNPSLTNVVYLAIGVDHPVGKGNPQPLVAQVWVNELRLIDVDNSKGWAYRMATELKLADLGAVAFNYQRVDPNFHTLENRFGSRALNTSWGVSASVELAKFLPSEWAGTTLPISFSRTESVVKPKYLPNSDVLVTKAAEQQHDFLVGKGESEADATAAANNIVYTSESKRTTDTWAAPSFRVALPGSWLVRDILNKLTFGFTYTKSNERSPSVVFRTSWSWNARIAYQLSFSPDYYFQPFTKLFEGVWFLDEYKDLKIYFAPSSLNWSVSAVRSRDNSLQRTDGATLITSRNFTASRQIGFAWKATEGGLLNLAGDYALSVESTLLNFELNDEGTQRPFSKIMSMIFFHDKLVNFGQDTRYSQRNNFTTKPNIPNIFGIKKYLDLSFGYSVDYAWQDALTSGDLGKSAGFNNSINLSLGVRLKQLFDPLFEESPGTQTQQQQPQLSRGRRSREGGEGEAVDSTAAKADTAQGQKKSLWKQLKMLMKVFIKIPVLDYDNVNISFAQTNSAQNSGVVGRTGFVNFWGRVPFFQSDLPQNGPSRLYQLGLISDPSGRLTHFRFTGTPPFVAWDVEPGIRAANGVLVNTYRQTNRLTFKTSRALWEGARLDLNWNVGWSYNRSQNIQTDSLGRPTVTNIATSGNVDRSFLTLPDVLFLGVFKTSLKEVAKRYGELKTAGDSTASDDEKLSQAFEQGFEALPFFRKFFGQFYPRVNWSLRWDGLEKLPMFQGFVSRLSLDHSYTSNYTRAYENRPGGGGERTDGQHVGYGFAPLVGLNFTFKELAKGSFGATFRYNTNTSYDLTTSSRNIVEALTQEISFSANYSRRGFEIPFFGLALNNDIDISASYSISKNSRTTYDVSKLDEDLTGTPLEGSTRTTMEPRVKYVLSSRVTAAIYYRYTKIEPDASGSRIPGTTTNEAGLDVHISIQ
ncbi:MAG TPA: cell surface protein SprA, partial [Bacteroidota bacterium]